MTKQDLLEYRRLKHECIQLKNTLDEMRDKMIFPKIPTLTGMPTGSPAGDRMAESIARYLEASDKYAQRLDELTSTLYYIEACIDQLPTQERILMRYRYINGLKWEEIAVAMNYSWRQVHNIHGKALIHIADIN